MTERILFLCQHGAAKSILAAAYSRAIASQRNLKLEIVAAGTEPDAQIAPAVIELMRKEQLDLSEKKPKLVTSADLQNATHIISMGCDLEKLLLTHKSAQVESWSDIPSPSQDLNSCYAQIRSHVERLIDQLQSASETHSV